MLIAENIIEVIAHCDFFLVEKKYPTNYRDMVSSLQEEIYHIQLLVLSWLLWTELQDSTQEATQGTRKHSPLACTGFGQMPCRTVLECIEISI